MKRSGKILLEGTIEEFKKHCKGADNREYLLINTKEIKKDGTYTIYQLDSNTERVVSISTKGKYVKKPFIPYDKQYLTFVTLSDGTFKFSGQTQGGASNCAISYSTDDGETWSVPSTNTTVNVQSGDKVMWKGEMNNGAGGPPEFWGIGKFKDGTARFEIQGNIMSLLYGDNFKNQTSFKDDRGYVFAYLFSNTSIISAYNLILPATTLSRLCYQDMFNSCVSLTTAPSVLPAITITASATYHSMFYNCTSLITAPQLPATTLDASCYYSMFQGCTSLTTAPQLPSTTLANYCYYNMFQGCTSLNSIKMLATNISASDCLTNWVNGVAASGTFVKAANATISTGNNGIPSGWTVVDYVEE